MLEEGFSLQQSVGDPLLVNRARIGLLQVLVSLGELDVSLRFASICVINEAGIVQYETKDTAEVDCIVTSLPSSSGPPATAAYRPAVRATTI